ncbi:MAG: hypothetical protein JSS00_10040 [Proteobacteria bacterium]|nr:hypothetical protein [Pseudomonadota bacterium]
MRLVFAGLLIAVLALPAAAQGPAPQQSQASPAVLDEVYACAQIGDEHQRLECYDRAVGRMHEAQNRGDLVAVDRQQAERVNREAFGFSLPSLGNLFAGLGGPSRRPTEDVAEISAHITRVAQDRSGRATFTLDNGQQWEQIDDENARNARSGGSVRVRRAMMGSFLMHVDAGGPALRVRRVQ